MLTAFKSRSAMSVSILPATVVFLIMSLPGSLLAQPAQQPGTAAVASAHYLASEAGHEIISAGGNAFDAAVAISAALAVVEPSSSGIGGGGFWMLHRSSDNMQVMVDGREIAPAAATADMYLDDQGEVNRDLAVNGPLAAGIPGHIAGIAHIADKYGKLSLAESLQPAIRLATQGFPVDEKYHTLMRYRADVIRRWPAAGKALLVAGEVPEIGTTIKLPDLAKTLQMVAENGPQAFYTGEFAAQLVRGVQAAGGIWSQDDLAAYQIKERAPISLEYQGYRIVTAPPPSSGGVALAEMLNIIEPYNIASLDRVGQVHLLVEAMRRAYRDRGIYLGDPDFVDMPIRQLTSRDYAAGLRASIRLDRATDSDMLAGFADSPKGMDTTHFSVLDAAGNMVAATLTVNLPYGSGFMVPGTGFLLNNEMDDFSAKPGEPNAFGLLGYTANAIEPGKRMLSSMTPSFVFGKDLQAALGTPGGSRIITMVLLGILDMIAGNEPASWVSLPRFHHQYRPDVISIEPDAFSTELIEQLQAKGHKVEARDSTWGNMHGVLWQHQDNAVSAGSDPRWPSGRAVVR